MLSSTIISNDSTLQEVWDESLEYVKDLEVKGQIRGVATYMNRSGYLFGISLAKELFQHCDNLSKALQTEKLSAAAGQNMAKCTLNTLQFMRSDAGFQSLYGKVKEQAESLNINDGPKLPRQKRP
jgi:hypothetical protein